MVYMLQTCFSPAKYLADGVNPRQLTGHPSGGRQVTGKSTVVDGHQTEPTAHRKRTRAGEKVRLSGSRQSLLKETRTEEFGDVGRTEQFHVCEVACPPRHLCHERSATRVRTTLDPYGAMDDCPSASGSRPQRAVRQSTTLANT